MNYLYKLFDCEMNIRRCIKTSITIQDVIRPTLQNVIRPTLQNVIRPPLQDVIRPTLQNVMRPTLQDVIRPTLKNVSPEWSKKLFFETWPPEKYVVKSKHGMYDKILLHKQLFSLENCAAHCKILFLKKIRDMLFKV